MNQQQISHRLALAALALPAFLALGIPNPARAQTTINVNTTAQLPSAPTDCTLSNAIVSANAASPTGGCQFVPMSGGSPYTIQLTPGTYTYATADNWWYGPNALPPIASSILVEGNGATLAITDPGIVRLRFFYVGADPNATATASFYSPGAGNLTLRHLTLTGGLQKGGDTGQGGGGAGMGGAIFNQGILLLDGVTLNGNGATGGSARTSGGTGGGGMGADSSGSGGGFGGPFISPGMPTPSIGGAGESGVTSGAGGGGGGGFLRTDNGSSTTSMQGANGGGTPDGLGGAGAASPHGGGNGAPAGRGSGGGGGGSPQVVSSSFGGGGGGFGVGGAFGSNYGAGGGGGVGGGGGDTFGNPDGGGGGGFGGGGGLDGGSGGFGGGGAGSNAGAAGRGGFAGGGGGLSGGGGGGMGGAIFNHGGSLTAINSTLAGNSATGGQAAFFSGHFLAEKGRGLGGAIFNLNGTVTLRFSTLAQNTADAGGAVYNLGYNLLPNNASLTVDNSILANSTDSSAAPASDLVNDQPQTVASGDTNVATATLTYQNANIVMSATGSSATPTSSANPQLAALALNAPGLTPTMAITTNSPAFNNGICEPLITTVDQRDAARPQSLCDLGAYEFRVGVPVTIKSVPSGLSFSVSGLGCSAGSYTSDMAFLSYDASCTVSFPSPQSGLSGTRYAFSSWADNNNPANPRTFPVPPNASTYTANFATQYFLTTAVSPSGTGSISPVSDYYTSGTVIVAAMAQQGYAFAAFSGALSGSTNPQSLTLNMPQTVTANFLLNPTVTVAVASGQYGGQVTLSATVTAVTAFASSLQFQIDHINVGGSLPVNGAGTYSTLYTIAVSAGPHTISASLAQSTYNQASSGNNTLTVSPATPSLTLNLPSSAVYGGSYNLTYTYTGDGTVSITSGTLATCTVQGSLLHFSGAGICTLVASATAGTNYAAVTGAPQSFNIAQATTTISINNIPTLGSAVYGGSFTPTYAYTGDGTKSFASSTQATCTVSNGVVSFAGAGTCALAASATAGTNYAAANGTTQSFNIAQATTTISISNIPTPGSAVYGGSFTPTYAYTGDGQKSFTSSTPATCTVSNGVVSFAGAGTCTLVASATAGTNYAAVTGAPQSFNIAQATTTISINNIPTLGSAVYGGSFTPTYAYTGDGTKSFASSTQTTCTVSNGVVSFAGAGTCTLVASATAGRNYAAASGAPQSFNIARATPVLTINNLPSNAVYGGSFTPALTYTGDGITSLSSNTPANCTVAPNGVVNFTGAGTCTLQASATMGNNYNAVSSQQSFSIAFTGLAPLSGNACNGEYNGTFNGNLTVSTGQTCFLSGGGVTGNITQTGGTLILVNAAITGNVQIQGPSAFTISPATTIGGNLQIQHLAASSTPNQVCGAQVHNDLQFQNNAAPVVIGGAPASSCPGNTIGGNLQVSNNTAATVLSYNTVGNDLQDQSNTAPTQVFNNTITGNLQCGGDSSITGGGNTAKQKQGQCAAF